MRPLPLLALVVLVGCSFDSETVATIENSCAGDASCAQGVCDANICIDDSGTSLDLAIEVVHGGTEGPVATPASWAFAAEPASGASRRDLLLPATRQVIGTVRWDGSPVPVTLRFVRRMDDPLAPLVPIAIEVDTLREPAAADGSAGYDFSTVLVAGETYELVVLPSSDMVMVPAQEPAPAIRTLPPLYLALPIPDGDASLPFRIDISFPPGLADDCTDNRDVGCTFHAKVFSRDSEDQSELPEAGLQVRAVDMTGRVVSSIAETDADGHFAIRVNDDASDYLIRITSSAGRAPFPAVSVDPDLLFADNPVDKVIYIPRLAPVQATGGVRDEIGRVVPGATVRFLSTRIFGGSQLGLEGSFGGTTTTNEDGSFGAELLTGFYSITVTPPEDIESDWGVHYDAAGVGEERTNIDTFVVPSQIGLSGTVSTYRNEPAAGATVLARARSTVDPGSVHRSQEVVSDDLGDFAMSVDIGLYDVQVKVASESGFAWLVEPALMMSLDEGDRRKEYRLEPPIAVSGVIRNGNGDVVPNALVRGYVFNDSGSGGRALQVAESVSNEDGSYRLLIAPRLVDE